MARRILKNESGQAIVETALVLPLLLLLILGMIEFGWVRAVTMSLNEGRPLVQSGKGRGLAKDYQLLAYKFLSEMGRGPEEQPRSLFAKRHI